MATPTPPPHSVDDESSDDDYDFYATGVPVPHYLHYDTVYPSLSTVSPPPNIVAPPALVVAPPPNIVAPPPNIVATPPPLSVGINGFNKAARFLASIIAENLQDDFKIVAINEPSQTPKAMAAEFLKEHGILYCPLSYNSLSAEGEVIYYIYLNYAIQVLAFWDNQDIPWARVQADVVIETISAENAAAHFVGGAKKVILCTEAPAPAQPPYTYYLPGKIHDDDPDVVFIRELKSKLAAA